jgi:hypothetical protein
MTYDGHFLKGGDQWLYYSYFNETPVEDAIKQKYLQGGAVGGTSAGMAVLGQYCYTAENESLLPWEGLENVFHPNITIETDFLNLLTGFITDTHFLQRGRLPRLGSMMANYFVTAQKSINGIACDDQTAVCIDERNIATVLGDGGAYVYRDGDFNVNNAQWYGYQKGIHLADSMQIDLTTFEIQKGPEQTSSTIQAEDINNNILLCGNNWIDESSPCVQQIAQLDDTLMILTGESRLVAATLLNTLDKLGKQDAFVLSATADNNDSSLWKLRNRIKRSPNVVFIENDFEALNAFLEGGPTGALIRSHIHRDEIFSAFFGEDCKLAGGKYCSNNLESTNHAYNGNLKYKNGLQLLPNSIFMPGAFDPAQEDYYENNTLSGLFALANDHLSFSLYIGSNSWVNFRQDGGMNYFVGGGKYSPVIVKNSAKNYETFAQLNGTGARNNASFDQLEIFTLNDSYQMPAGKTIVSQDPPYEFEEPEKIVTGLANTSQGVRVLSNITNQDVYVVADANYIAELIPMCGKHAERFHISPGTNTITILQPGVYVLRIIHESSSRLIKSQKILRF